jgi:hypothetical protein
MLYDRKALTRLALVFGISAVSYATAGFAASQARDHLLARAQMLHDMRHQIAVGAVDGPQFTASLSAAR